MDNLTHSLVGAALSEAGPRDRYALATPTLILAANVPDVDVLSYLVADEFAALAWRRGITHGVPALVLWPFVVAATMLAWDRLVRRRGRPDAAPARFAPLLALSAAGALTHPALDWLNTYGMRWWLPFDGTWSYGDSVFIIDPWLWLLLGGAVFLARSATRRGVAAWALGAALASLLVLGTGMVPPAAKAAWVMGLVVVGATRRLRPAHARPERRQRIARAAVVGAATYVLAMIGTSALAERATWSDAVALGVRPMDVMTGPRPASLVTRDVVVRTAEDYRMGTWAWGRTPRIVLDDPAVPIRQGPDAVLNQAMEDPQARHFLTWSRYPYAHAREDAGGWTVRIGDVRYPGRGLGGLEVSVPLETAARPGRPDGNPR
jgi:inner membrane protein